MSSEERILKLCRRAVAASEEEAEPILAELKAALREHMMWTRQKLSAYPFARVHSPSLVEMGN